MLAACSRALLLRAASAVDASLRPGPPPPLCPSRRGLLRRPLRRAWDTASLCKSSLSASVLVTSSIPQDRTASKANSYSLTLSGLRIRLKAPSHNPPPLRPPPPPVPARPARINLPRPPARQRHREHQVVVRPFPPRAVLLPARGAHLHAHLRPFPPSAQRRAATRPRSSALRSATTPATPQSRRASGPGSIPHPGSPRRRR